MVHTLGHALAGKAAGVGIEEIGLFWGPALVRVRIAGILYVVNLLPCPGGYIKFRPKDLDELGNGLDDLHPLRRILVIAAGCLALLAVASACLGPVHGMRSLWHGFRELVRGGLDPIGTGAPLLRSLFKLVRVNPYSTCLGIVAAKMAAMNLLPLRALDGGEILWNLIQWRRRYSERIAIGATSVGLLGAMILHFGWFVAFLQAVRLG